MLISYCELFFFLDIDARDKNGNTPLHCAAIYNRGMYICSERGFSLIHSLIYRSFLNDDVRQFKKSTENLIYLKNTEAFF